MTTIACTRDGMAGDGMMSQAGVVHSLTSKKVFRLNDGSLAGFSGDPFAIEEVIGWLQGHRDPCSFPAVSNSGMEVLVLQPDGTCLCFNKHGHCYDQSLPAALGSGAAAALGAMHAGAVPGRAVEIADRLDTCTGGEITYEALHENHDAIR